MSSKKNTPGAEPAELSAELARVVSRIERLHSKMEKAEAAQPPSAALRKRRSKQAERELDRVVNTNALGDLHRRLLDFAETDELPAAGRRDDHLGRLRSAAACEMVASYADLLAAAWRSFTPKAGLWTGLEPLQARSRALNLLQHRFESVYEDIAEKVIDNLHEQQEETVLGDPKLKPGKVDAAFEQGVREGRQVILDTFAELQQERPCRLTLGSAREREQGLSAAFKDVQQVLAAHPVPQSKPRTHAALLGQCLLETAQEAVSQAFNLAAGRDSATEYSLPLQFAGSILTRMGVSQEYLSEAVYKADGSQVSKHGDDEYAPPKAINCVLAETPKAVMWRELLRVGEVLGDSLQDGTLKNKAVAAYNQRAAGRFNGGARRVDADLMAKAFAPAGAFLDQVIVALELGARESDGWLTDRSKLTTREAVLEDQPPARTQFPPR